MNASRSPASNRAGPAFGAPSGRDASGTPGNSEPIRNTYGAPASLITRNHFGACWSVATSPAAATVPRTRCPAVMPVIVRSAAPRARRVLDTSTAQGPGTTTFMVASARSAPGAARSLPSDRKRQAADRGAVSALVSGPGPRHATRSTFLRGARVLGATLASLLIGTAAHAQSGEGGWTEHAVSVRLMDAPRTEALAALAELAGVQLELAPGIDGRLDEVVRGSAIDALSRVVEGVALVDIGPDRIDVVPLAWRAALVLPPGTLVPEVPVPDDPAARLPGNTASLDADGTLRIAGHPRFVERIALSRLLP